MTPQIYYSEQLIQSWEMSLRSAFGQSQLRIDRKPSKAVGRFYVAVPAAESYIARTGDDATQYLTNVRRDDIPPKTFWFSFKANFDLWTLEQNKGRQHFLEHASICVYQRIADSGFIPMFRGEWDSRAAKDASSKHAQPHWHFVQRPEQFEYLFESGSPSPQEFAGEDAKANDIQKFGAVIDFSGFHFAMSPLWSPGVSLCQKQMFTSAKEVGAWFGSLTTYISDQLAYIVTKLPRNLIPVPEFKGL
jgi:hypothetical protein